MKMIVVILRNQIWRNFLYRIYSFDMVLSLRKQICNELWFVMLFRFYCQDIILPCKINRFVIKLEIGYQWLSRNYAILWRNLFLRLVHNFSFREYTRRDQIKFANCIFKTNIEMSHCAMISLRGIFFKWCSIFLIWFFPFIYLIYFRNWNSI